MSEATLHHDPVNCPGEVNICGQEHNVFSLEGGDGFVDLHEVGHDLVEGALPLAGCSGTRTGVGTVLAHFFVVHLLRVEQGRAAT